MAGMAGMAASGAHSPCTIPGPTAAPKQDVHPRSRTPIPPSLRRTSAIVSSSALICCIFMMALAVCGAHTGSGQGTQEMQDSCGDRWGL